MNNVLFVCLYNMNRSPTAAYVYKEMMRSKRQLTFIKTAGLDPYVEKAVNPELLDWASRIFVMERYMINYLPKDDTRTMRKVRVLDIPRGYTMYERELVELVRERLMPYIINPFR